MPIYEYKGLTSSGRQCKGVIEADSVRVARVKLKQKDIFPTTLVESEAKKETKGWNKSVTLSSGKVSTAQLAIATRQLATLIGASMPIVEALKALSEQVEQTSFKRTINAVGEKVNEGSTLANAMRLYPKAFPRLYVNMIGSGEASGSLDVVLERLADLLEAQAMLRRKVLSALTYPVMMLCLCFGVIVLLLIFVVPQITAIFKDQNKVLPLPTQIVMGLSEFTQNYWYVVIAVIALAILAFKAYARTVRGKRRIDSILLRLPLIGSLVIKAATSRFSRNLGTMLNSGIEILQALGIAKNIVGNVILEEFIDQAQEGVKEGRSLAAELKKANVWPTLLIHMVAIGEQTGSVDTMLIRAAKNYESEIDAFVSGLTSILEPVLIIFLAVIVGAIIASVMLPMLEMSSFSGM
ncbi:MAG: type II secretion system inner membrane protein GspF [Deltaproteobacteria bacterium]|nr:type II secretion system inner membrane protein GspF [Deltaproteobacteria bacterium]